MIMRCMLHGDFQEGIRAVLVDKDNQPKWAPATLAEVPSELIDSYFESLGEYELILP
jgi:enoyl-CoA hydratase